MSGNIVTREFSIDDYDTVLQLWQRVEGLEVAEGDDREGVAQFIARNPGLSRVAMDAAAVIGVVDISTIWPLIQRTAGAASASVLSMNAWKGYEQRAWCASLSWLPMTILG